MDAVGNATLILGLLIRVLQANLYTVHEPSRDQSTNALFGHSVTHFAQLYHPCYSNVLVATCFVSCHRAALSSGHRRGDVAGVCSDFGKLALLGAIHMHAPGKSQDPCLV